MYGSLTIIGRDVHVSYCNANKCDSHVVFSPKYATCTTLLLTLLYTLLLLLCATRRGPFVLALDKSWCPDHFNCANPSCRRPLIDCGFVEEDGQLYCEKDYEQFMAPRCGKCGGAIVGVSAGRGVCLCGGALSLHAIAQLWHNINLSNSYQPEFCKLQ